MISIRCYYLVSNIHKNVDLTRILSQKMSKVRIKFLEKVCGVTLHFVMLNFNDILN